MINNYTDFLIQEELKNWETLNESSSWEELTNKIFKYLDEAAIKGDKFLVRVAQNIFRFFKAYPKVLVLVIGILAAKKLIGLSKYTRIAQWCARRGTLQEELCNDIAREIMRATDSRDVGVYIQATHGCCENRGIMAHSSLTQTTVLHGAFRTDPAVKKEFTDNIKLQQDFAPR
jgi:hypothetical protein